MIKEARGFGNTIDEAKEKAIADLHASEEDDIQFEVISTPKKKTLGLFGGRQAEVRVFIEIPDEKPKPQKKAALKAQKKENKPATAPTPKKEAQKPQDNPAPAQSRKYDIHEGYGEAVDASEIPSDSKAGKAVAYLKTILLGLGCTELKIKVAEKENAALIELDGEGLGAVIGHRGETLDSIQYLTGLAANNGGGYYKVAINIGNYREKREEALINLAKRVSAQVLKTGKSRSLEPMNPYERRIIHTAVQGIDGVVSNSFGEGGSRRVVIAVEGGEIRPPKREGGKRDGYSRRRAPQKPVAAPAREPKRDSDMPLYGKIN
ncbi:MAG: RNA-binding cell elongation regulator Jag/EloR [Acutalibacteraceae bacterium]